jgi:hypothetical protein
MLGPVDYSTDWDARCMGLSLQGYAAYMAALSVISAAVHLAIALFIFACKPEDGVALLVSLILVTFRRSAQGVDCRSDPGDNHLICNRMRNALQTIMRYNRHKANTAE